MESLLSLSSDVDVSTVGSAVSAKASADAAALNSLKSDKRDSVDFDFSDLYKSLSVSARKIIDALNEMLAEKLPNGIQSLKPEEVTPEATADRIVSQVTSLFSAYRKQHKDMTDEEALNGFMEAARSGVAKGYEDAFKILEGLGAFEYEGVQSGVEETKRLIEEKLTNFEKVMRQQLGIDAANTDDISAPVTKELLAQGGAKTLQLAA